MNADGEFTLIVDNQREKQSTEVIQVIVTQRLLTKTYMIDKHRHGVKQTIRHNVIMCIYKLRRLNLYFSNIWNKCLLYDVNKLINKIIQQEKQKGI